MPIRKDIRRRIACDKRGKITTGNRGKDEKENPRSWDCFNLIDFPELKRIYGEQPTKLLIMFPTDNVEDFYSTEYSLWGGTKEFPVKKMYCDGETCTDGVTKKKIGPCCRLADHSREKCEHGMVPYMGLKAYVLDTNGNAVNFVPYMFESHSVNTADALYTSIEDTHRKLGGKLVGVPFLLSVEMVQKLDENSKKKRFPIWSIQPAGPAARMYELAQQAAIPIEGMEVPRVKALGAGAAMQQEVMDKTEAIKIIKMWYEGLTLKDTAPMKKFKQDALETVYGVKTLTDVYKLDAERLTVGITAIKEFDPWYDHYFTECKNGTANWDAEYVIETLFKYVSGSEVSEIVQGEILPTGTNN